MEEAARLAAETLTIPAEHRTAFAELFGCLHEKLGQEPAIDNLEAWNGSRYLGRSRAEATVRAMLEERGQELRSLVAQVAPAVGKDEDQLLRQAEQRFIFMGVYVAGTPLEDLFRNLLHELQTLTVTAKGEPEALKLAPGVFDARHLAIRASAYPYRPACASNIGDEVLECLLMHKGQHETPRLIGFMAMHGSYADDVSVDPSFQGRGIAKALVSGVAARLQQRGEAQLTLDVRACNLPALGLYKALGFEVVERHFPGFYDWHGGYRLRAATEVVTKHLSASIDIASLHDR